MTQDFAHRANSPRPGNGGLPGWVWFLTGLASGVFTSFLFYLWHEVPADPDAQAIIATPDAKATPSKTEDMKWDFYDIFPKSSVPVVEEYGQDGEKQKVEGPYTYLLQAGSFRHASDADELRAQLILLGLDAFTKPATKDGATWYRVMIGPIKSSLEMERQRRKLAENNIASIALRISP